MSASGRLASAVIAVHVGAGQYFNESKDAQYKAICDRACMLGAEALRAGADAAEACALAIAVLEDDPLTNAGIGSTLNAKGFVECDAGLMDGASGLFGAVASVPCTLLGLVIFC